MIIETVIGILEKLATKSHPAGRLLARSAKWLPWQTTVNSKKNKEFT